MVALTSPAGSTLEIEVVVSTRDPGGEIEGANDLEFDEGNFKKRQKRFED